MTGKIYIITNALYGANVYVIQSAQDPKQKVIELSSVFLTPLELKYVSSESTNIDNILLKVYDELKYNRIDSLKPFFMLPNLIMVQDMINNLINENKVIKPIKKIVKKVIPKVEKEIKNPLDELTDDFIDSDEEDITSFRNLLKVTDKSKIENKTQIENKTKNQIIVKK